MCVKVTVLPNKDFDRRAFNAAITFLNRFQSHINICNKHLLLLYIQVAQYNNLPFYLLNVFPANF